MGSCSGLDFDASTCSNWSVQEKTELVYELSECSDESSEMLQAWSRQDILEILCAEMGKERKYTGLTKSKLVENLLKIVNEKKSQSSDLKLQPSSDKNETAFKRPLKVDTPNDDDYDDSDLGNTVYCKNSACKAILNQSDAFCKRCSCCICRLYDDNKDPSLWLVCSSEPLFQGDSCGMSCHLECAIKHEKTCIGKKIIDDRLDGAFRCVSCGKVNDLLGSCRKQLIVARDTRRVDIMCYRLSLCQKMLSNTKCYLKIHEIVEECINKLEADVGPLTGLPVKKARGIVNRLSSGPEIQKLCTSALESLDSMNSTCRSIFTSNPLTNCSSLSNPSSVEDETTNILPGNNEIRNKGNNYLAYFEDNCRGVSADVPHSLANCTSESQRGMLGAKVSLLQESNGTGKLVLASGTKTINLETEYSPDARAVEEMSTAQTGLECVPYVGNSESHLPITPPCKSETMKNIAEKSNGRPKPHTSSKVDIDCGSGKEEDPQAGSSSKKRSAEQRDIECTEIGGEDFEYYVKVIRWLECEGHVEKSFREKFLTWYSLRAKPQEVRIVKVFVDTLIEDPESLAGQLVDTFSDVVSNKRSCIVSAGFCHKLWH